MGIQGLTSYVDSIGGLWTRSQLTKTRVVIDGSCLFYHLSAHLNCQRGGQYKEFHDSTVRFFYSLKRSSVEPWVVLDGAYDASDRKLDTVTQRMKNSIADASRVANGPPDCEHVLPLLTRRTFMQAMEEVGIKFVVCDCEADEEIAFLANYLDCPVISNDSDFFIHDLKRGYIPLKHLDYHTKPLTADLFEREKLAKHLGVSVDLLPLLASLLGNDFVSSETLMPFHSALKRVQATRQSTKRNQRLTSVAYFLCEFNSLADGLQGVMRVVPERGREKLRKALELSIKAYTELKSELPSYIEHRSVQSRLLSISQGALEPWVLMKFRQGLFPTGCMNAFTVGKVFLRVQVENFGAVSANQCSLELRRSIYGILIRSEAEQVRDRAEALGGAAVREWDRDKKGLRNCVVKPHSHAQGYGELPCLRTIPDQDVFARRQLCLLLLDSDTSLMRNLPAELQLFAASLRHWILHANPPVEEVHLRALIMCSLRLTENERTREFQASQRKGGSPPRGAHSPFNLAAQHSFAQWQSVMQEALHLNLLLQEPLITPRIRNLYDGLLVQDLVSKLERGQRAHALLTCVDEFEMLYQTATDGVAARLVSSAPGHNVRAPKVGPGDLERTEKSRGRTPRRKVEVNANVPTGNRFGFLDVGSDSSSTEDDDET